jgi:hypothetical protein
MTALSTVSAGIKPPTSIPQDTTWRHQNDPVNFADYFGTKLLLCTGGGVAVEELNVTGSGYLQILCAGINNAETVSINLTLTLDGVELYNYTIANGRFNGPIAAGMAGYLGFSSAAAASMDAYRFEQGFTVDITTSATACYLLYKYYLDS